MVCPDRYNGFVVCMRKWRRFGAFRPFYLVWCMRNPCLLTYLKNVDILLSMYTHILVQCLFCVEYKADIEAWDNGGATYRHNL